MKNFNFDKIRLKKKSDIKLIDSDGQEWNLEYFTLSGYLSNVSYKQGFKSLNESYSSNINISNFQDIKASDNKDESKEIVISGDFVHTNAYVHSEYLTTDVDGNFSKRDDQNIEIRENDTNITKLEIYATEGLSEIRSTSYGFGKDYWEHTLGFSMHDYATCFSYFSYEKASSIVKQLQNAKNTQVNMEIEVLAYSMYEQGAYSEDKSTLFISEEINSFSGESDFPSFVSSVFITPIKELNSKEILNNADREILKALDLTKDEEHREIKEKALLDIHRSELQSSRLLKIQLLLVLIILILLFK